jgi:hypothetical protein
MSDTTDTPDAPPAAAPFPAPSLEDLQHWTFVMGRAPPHGTAPRPGQPPPTKA